MPLRKKTPATPLYRSISTVVIQSLSARCRFLRKARLAFWGLGYQTPRLGYLYDGVQIQRKCADDGGDDDVGEDGSANEYDDVEHDGDDDDNDNLHHFIRHLTIVICRTGCKFKGNTSQDF